MARQFRGVFALSIRRLARSKFMLACLVLTALPIFVAVVFAIAAHHSLGTDISRINVAFEWMLRLMFLYLVVFFVANVFGFAVIRQENDDQTLHYILLQPIGRWLVIVSKLVAYLALASVVCVASLWATYLVMTVPHAGVGAVVAELFGKGRVVILAKESVVLCLGLLAYGAIAMAMASVFKSAFYALFLLAWEAALPYLPTTLKYWTVMFYLQSLLPEKLVRQREVFQMLSDPASTPLCLVVLVAAPIVATAICTAIFQMRECLYGET